MYSINELISLQSPALGQMTFSKAASPKALGIFTLHDDIMIVLTVICFFVLWILLSILINFRASKKWSNEFRNDFSFFYFQHAATLLETVWTITPAIIILIIASPSFSLLYSLEELFSPEYTLKAIGHQWFWEYECDFRTIRPTKDFEDISEDDSLFESKFNAYIKKTDDVQKSHGFRLLDTDFPLALPTETKIRLIVTSADVLHCWAVPAFGVKLDACPGRLNATTLFIDRLGIFYGQCSEICGVNHGFMPIHVRTLRPNSFLSTSLS